MEPDVHKLHGELSNRWLQVQAYERLERKNPITILEHSTPYTDPEPSRFYKIVQLVNLVTSYNRVRRAKYLSTSLLISYTVYNVKN